MPHARSWRFWVACSLSLLLHGGLLALLVLAPARGSGEDRRPLRADAVAFDEAGEELPLTVLPLPPTPPAPLARAVAQAATPLESAAPARATPTEATILPAGTGASGPGSAAAVAPRQGVVPAFFAVPARGRSVVYVLDRSTSMGAKEYLPAVKRELLASLSQLPESSRFQVIFYNGQADTLQPGRHALLPATDENKQFAARQVEPLLGEGGTKHLAALQLALALEPEVIYFLTDADDLTPALVREVTRLNNRRAVIHTFELTRAHRDRDMPLQALARQNRGEYRTLSLR